MDIAEVAEAEDDYFESEDEEGDVDDNENEENVEDDSVRDEDMKSIPTSLRGDGEGDGKSDTLSMATASVTSNPKKQYSTKEGEKNSVNKKKSTQTKEELYREVLSGEKGGIPTSTSTGGGGTRSTFVIQEDGTYKRK